MITGSRQSVHVDQVGSELMLCARGAPATKNERIEDLFDTAGLESGLIQVAQDLSSREMLVIVPGVAVGVDDIPEPLSSVRVLAEIVDHENAARLQDPIGFPYDGWSLVPLYVVSPVSQENASDRVAARQ